MMRNTSFTALCALLVCTAAHAAYDDPPGRVARVNLLDGTGAMQLAGTESWIDNLLNRPLTGGDKLWIEAGSRAEMHIGSAALRLGERTALQIVRVDDRTVRLSLTAGSLSVRIRALDRDDRFEIETPAGEVALVQPGGYRLDVGDRDEHAHLAVWSGRAEVSGRSGVTVVRTDEGVDLNAGDSPAIELASAGATDNLDLWAEDRDRREDQSRSARYVSRDVVGYEELDSYGDWTVDPLYGSLWVPRVVVVDWAPYRFGYWNWIGPWGWTWIDDAPWGFAPCHYGRWVHAHRGWAWAPGEREERRPVFAPALVAWRGDRYPRHGSAAGQAPKVGWVPLGYNEIYEPPFRASHDYVRAANQSNTHLGQGAINRYIDQRQRVGAQRPERRYVNDGVPGAYTAVTRDTFASARPVGRNRLQSDASEPNQAPLGARAPDIAPKPHSLGRELPVDRPAARPDRSVFERPVRSADGERMRERVPMQQRHVEPIDQPTARPFEAPVADQPRLRQRESEPADRPQNSRMQSPTAPRAYEREYARDSQPRYQSPPIYSPPVAAPAAPVERSARPVFSAPPVYRAPAPAAPQIRSAPPPAPPVLNREDRRQEIRQESRQESRQEIRQDRRAERGSRD